MLAVSITAGSTGFLFFNQGGVLRSATFLRRLASADFGLVRKKIGNSGNQTLAAQILGIDRISLWRKLKRYQME